MPEIRQWRGARWAVPALVLLLFAAVTAAYSPGLRGPFVFDDSINIVDNPAVSLDPRDFIRIVAASISDPSGLSKRPLATLSFAIDHDAAGGFGDTFTFKRTNLIIHLINTALIGWLAALLLRQLRNQGHLTAIRSGPLLPLAVAAIWAAHPLNHTTVLYVVQRMTSLSALFVLAGTTAFVYGRQRVESGSTRGLWIMFTGLFAGLGFGLGAKENAILMPALLLVIELAFFGRSAKPAKPVVWFYTVAFMVLALIAAAYFARHHGSLSGAYSLREFTLYERLLTEARILWLYVGMLLFPDIRSFTLFHDDIQISTSLISPGITLLAVMGLLAAAITAVALRRRYPVFFFSVLWFLVGHSLESSVIPLELVHEHRNYLPLFGPMFGLTYAFGSLLVRIGKPGLAPAIAAVVVATLLFSTHVLARNWSDEPGLVRFMLAYHPRSARTHAMQAEILYRDNHDALGALDHYKTAADLMPHEAAYPIMVAVVTTHTEVRATDGGAIPTGRVRTEAGPLPEYLTLRVDGGTARLALTRSFEERIVNLLATGPVNAQTDRALAVLVSCAVEEPYSCRHLHATSLRWYQTALANPRTTNDIRRAMLVGVARLHVAAEDYPAALEAAKWARRLDPNHPTLKLMEANIHYLLGASAEARRVLSLLEPSTLDNKSLVEYHKLSKLIAASPKPPTP